VALGLGCEDELPVAPDESVSGAFDLAHDFRPAPDHGDEDGGGDSPDLAGPPAVHGVPCGNATCFAEANQYCHTQDWGQTGTCEMAPAPEPGYYACDGPEDCPTGACCFLDDASVCGLYGFCAAGTIVGEFMCHTDGDCGQNVQSRCCPKGKLGHFSTCIDGLGPSQPCPPAQ
jgi:hypothetical protein